MRVVVANVTGGGLSGGYRKYLQRLMPLLAADRRIARLTIFVPGASGAVLDPSLEPRSFEASDRGRRALIDEVRALSPDVVFVPTARYLEIDRPVVTMVRNMEPLTVPFGGNSWREGVRNLARAGQAKHASRRSTRVIAVSRFVREFLVNRWRIPSARIGLVYHGVDQLEPANAVQPRTLFTAGSIRPARGLEDAIDALVWLPPDVHLRIAGRVDPGAESYGARLHERAQRAGVRQRVAFTGQLGVEQMNGELSTCGVFVMTSRAEACPNTALEAMSAGAGIVSVDHAPMPEFFGDAALYYRAGDGRACAERIASLIDGGAGRSEIAARARTRARQFTWTTTADLTIRELESALA